jgi:hypothetical protein
MKKIFQSVFFLLFAGVMSVNAQVRIGSDENPHDGSILDLSNAGSLGMLLPRVPLDAANVFKLSGDAAAAAGMVVYNTNAAMANGYGAGLYVWDGAKWNIMGQGTTAPFIPGDYGTPDATYNPLMSGATCIDVRVGHPALGTLQYDVSETGTGTIANVIWSVLPSTQGLLVSNSASGTGNTTQRLVFKSQAELLALATSADQTIVLIAYIEYSDGTKVQLSTIVKIQNQAWCLGYLIINGAFTGTIPSSIGYGLGVDETLALFSSATRQDLCVGPDFGANRTWYSVTGTFCNTNVHDLGGAWNDGNNDWRLPNIAELANMQAIKGSIPNFAMSYWSSTDAYEESGYNTARWNFNGSGSITTNHKMVISSGIYTRCVRTMN